MKGVGALKNESTPAAVAPPEACLPGDGRGPSFVQSSKQLTWIPTFVGMTELRWAAQPQFSCATD